MQSAAMTHPRALCRFAFIVAFAFTSLASLDAQTNQARPLAPPKRDRNALRQDPSKLRLELFLNAMGGREAWKNIKSVTVRATHYEPTLKEPYANAIFNDFMQPRCRFEAKSAEIDRQRAINIDSGWRIREGEHFHMTPKQFEEDRAWWEANIYRTVVRLCNDDPDLTATAVGDHRLEIHKADGKRLNWFELNATGEPIRFGTGDNEDGTIFGPLTSAGAVKYPRWGANPSATFRYEVTEFLPSTEPPTVSFDKPTKPAPPAK
jgi:hypothetical protein